MPTNEDRRDVAARLRAVTDEELRLCFTEEILYGCLNNQNCLDSKGNIDEYLVLQAIADLIEPEPERTCLNMADNYDGMGFVCSKCTRAVPEDEYDIEVDEYCSGCGAKVV